MADTENPIAQPGDTSTPGARSSTRKEFSQRTQEEIDESADVATAAQKPAYATILHDEYDLDAQIAVDLTAKALEATRLKERVTALRRDEKVDTTDDEADRLGLLAAIERVQTGAHLKFDKLTDETQKRRELQRYYVGANLSHASHTDLDNAAAAILLQLDSETLPSVKAAQIQALRDALAEFREDGDDEPDAQALYEQLIALLKEMKPLRRAIQIAANSAFTFRKPANAATRREFHIPTKRPFV